MRSPRRFRRAVLAALSAGMLVAAVAGCGSGGDRTTKGTTGTAEATDVLLQPLAVPGPGPFTASSAATTASSSPTGAPDAGPTSATRTVQPVSGAAPGLYGGTRSVAACDVERQTRLLTAEENKARAFAKVAGVEAVQIPGYLKSLTPVVLRADTRVTGHGYSAGSATAFQAVLQAGTAVLVDSRGLPRVRCVCGNPLVPPVVADGKVAHRGERWPGYDPARIVAVEPGEEAVTSLVIVDTEDNTWIERTVGDSGGRDRTPDDPPPFAPSDDLLFPSPSDSSGPSSPDPTESGPAPSAPADPTGTGPGTESPDDFGGTPPGEPWEYGEEGDPDVAPEPTRVSPAEPEEPAGPDGPAAPDEPMEAGLPGLFAG